MSNVQGLAEVDLRSREQRRPIDGDEPFPADAQDILRIAYGNATDVEAAEKLGVSEDSRVTLLLPDVSLDSDAVFKITLRILMGPCPLALIAASETLPRDTLDYVITILISRLRKPMLESASRKLAAEVDYMGLWVLHQRIRQTEQSVRDALNDEEFTTPDLEALRGYPTRLAHVEAAARRLRREPSVESARPEQKTPFERIAPPPRIGTRFVDYVDEAEKEARDAVARLSGLISSQQIVLTKHQAVETARFQRLVTIVGAAVLVPGLVAAIFGANVGFRGRESIEAFWAMLLLMAGSGIASYVLIRSFETSAWHWLAERKPFDRLPPLPIKARLGAWAALSCVAIVAGLLILLNSRSQ